MPVSVSGTGAISALGIGTDAIFDALCKGIDCLKPFPLPDLRSGVPPLCAAVEQDLELLAGREGLFKTLALATIAAKEAMLPLQSTDGLRLGIVAATTMGGISRTERVYRRYREDPQHLASLAIEASVHEPAALGADLCRTFGGCGLHTVSTGCSSGLQAIGTGKRLIERGFYDACLVVGADALCITAVRGFGSLALLDPAGCRPFDAQRAGMSLGEGAGALLLLSPEASGRYALPTLATIDGWGASSDCRHLTVPDPEGNGMSTAIRAALDEARLSNNDIDLVVTHGIGTPDHDFAEISAMKKVFPEVPPFCSFKRSLGHTLGASGTLEVALAIKAGRGGIVPPTAGFSAVDERIGLAPASQVRAPIRHMLKNTLGFGGNNAALIISTADES